MLEVESMSFTEVEEIESEEERKLVCLMMIPII